MACWCGLWPEMNKKTRLRVMGWLKNLGKDGKAKVAEKAKTNDEFEGKKTQEIRENKGMIYK